MTSNARQGSAPPLPGQSQGRKAVYGWIDYRADMPDEEILKHQLAQNPSTDFGSFRTNEVLLFKTSTHNDLLRRDQTQGRAGLPLDLVVYEADQFQTNKVVCIDENNPYFRMLHGSWGQKLRQVFDSIEDPMWNGEQTAVPLMLQSNRSQPLQKSATRKKS